MVIIVSVLYSPMFNKFIVDSSNVSSCTICTSAGSSVMTLTVQVWCSDDCRHVGYLACDVQSIR